MSPGKRKGLSARIDEDEATINRLARDFSNVVPLGHLVPLHPVEATHAFVVLKG